MYVLPCAASDTGHASSRPATSGAGRRPPVVSAIAPASPGREKGTLFCFAPPLHRHADVRLCCAGKRPKGARSPIFGHTRVIIGLFRQICNLIPAQNLLTHSIKYGQTHRQKMSLPLPAVKNTTRLGGVFGSPSPDHADESALLSRTQRAPGTLLPFSRP